MKITIPQFNLVIAWLWILLGFVTGMLLGLFFHRENWLGGYGSFRRRMYRLGHISLFGLGAVNLLFYFTVQSLGTGGELVRAASWAFIAGAISMPVCCMVTAHRPRLHMIFAVPVVSLIAGGVLMLAVILGSDSFTISRKSTPNPSTGGEETGVRGDAVPLLGGVRGGFVKLSEAQQTTQPWSQS